MTQHLVTYQSLWAMEGLPIEAPGAWSLDEQLELIAGAGFDGVSLSSGFGGDDAELPGIADRARAAGLRVYLAARPPGPDVRSTVETATTIDADFVVLCGNAFPLTVAEGVDLVGGWWGVADDAGVTIHLETHRGTITNDLHYTLALIDQLPDVQLSADLSHYVVAHGMDELMFASARRDELLSMISTVLERSVSFQGRVASANQVQLQLGFPGAAPWVQLFRDWWRQGFTSWRARSGPDDEGVFICELGGAPYPSTGPDGRELSDRWLEAQQLRSWALEAFAEAGAGPD